MSKTPRCPLLKKPCIEHECAWYMSLMGKDPQTGDQVKEWDCAIKWGVVAQIETTGKVIGTAKEIEALRKESLDGVERLENELVFARNQYVALHEQFAGIVELVIQPNEDERIMRVEVGDVKKRLTDYVNESDAPDS